MKTILVIGNGLAGMTAAIRAAELGCSVILAAPTEPNRSQSVMASGGINAALNTKGEDDSPAQHAEDTLRAGCGLADPQAVQEMTEATPQIIEVLSRRGVVFDRDQTVAVNPLYLDGTEKGADVLKAGNIALRNFGGQKKKRTAYAKSGIGMQLVTAIMTELRRYQAEGRVTSLYRRKFVSPVFAAGRCAGAVFENTVTGSLETVQADAVIAASGGMGGLFDRHTGSDLSDGSVTAALFAKGAAAANLEMIQYHPTTISTPAKNMLVSEAARGEGGRLFTMRDGKRWYFMEEWYPEGGNLMPRDVVSRAIHKVCKDGFGLDGQYQVGLELETLPKETVSEKLKEISELAKTYLGIDASHEFIPVSPAIHYFMGGLYVDRFHRTTLPGVYAAGECACQYHGANRLGANSTLGAIYGGMIAAETAAREAEGVSAGEFAKAAEAEEAAIRDRLSLHRAVTREINAVRRLKQLMSSSLGIIRDEAELQAGLLELAGISPRDVYAPKNHTADAILFEDKLLLARAILSSALARKESRGGHARADYPQTDEAFCKVTVAEWNGSDVQVRFDEIGRVFA